MCVGSTALSVIRRSEGVSRDLDVSQVTARKVLRSEATSFLHERRTQPRPKIGRWRSDLEGMPSKNPSRPKRERITLMRIYEDLRELGCEGGYDAVPRYASR